MPHKEAFVLIAAGVLALGAAAFRQKSESSFPIRESEEIRRTMNFPEPGRPGELVVDNLHGKIEVLAADRTDIELVAVKTILAKTPEKLALAKKEVVLDIGPRGEDIDIYVDGPFRCQVGDCRGFRQRDWGYEVRYDFVLKVPRRTNLTLKTVDDGDIAVRGIEGAFDVSHVNGGILLESVSGEGEAGTVNGEVRVSFARNPGGPCSFKTVNGDVSLIFRGGLAADFRLNSRAGKAYSDFASTALPPETLQTEKRANKTIYRRDGFTGIRVGRGGPEIRCTTLHGDILIKKND